MANSINKNKIQTFMDSESRSRDKWIKKAKFYYNDILKLFRYNIPSSTSVLEIGWE